MSPLMVSVAPFEIITFPSIGPSEAQVSLAEIVFVEPSVCGFDETKGMVERLVIISRAVMSITLRIFVTRSARSSMLLLHVEKSID
jgi:hypothetical protein